MTAIAIASDAHWHELRAQHVGCSEIGALFDADPFRTRYALWHEKVGNLPPADLSDNERVTFGQFLEPAIAAATANRTGWKIQKVRRYISSDAVPGFGGTLDYEIVSNDRGPGVLEIKNVDYLVWKKWDEGEPPLHQQLQVQGQIALTGRRWGALAVLVGGNELKVFEYERRQKTVELIEHEVGAFWGSVHGRVEPKPVWEQDVETIAALYSVSRAGSVLDLTASNRLPEICAAYQKAGVDEKEAGQRKDAAKAELLTLIGDSEVTIGQGWRIKSSMIAETTFTATRKGYRRLTISEKTA